MDFYKMSGLFLVLCGLVMLLLKVSSTLTARHNSGRNLAYQMYTLFRHPAYIAVVGVLLVGAIVWFVVSRVRKTDGRYKAFTGTNALFVMLYVAGFSVYFGRRPLNNASDCMFVLASTLILALLYYIYKIYDSDFLLFSVENALLALLLYRYWHVYTTGGLVGKGLFVVLFVFWGIFLGGRIRKKREALASVTPAHKQKALLFPYFVSLAVWTVFMFIKIRDPYAASPVSSGVMLTVLLLQYLFFAIVYTIRRIRE